jgi:hypothetical protein
MTATRRRSRSHTRPCGSRRSRRGVRRRYRTTSPAHGAELQARLGPGGGGHDIGDAISQRGADGATHQSALWRLESGVDRRRPLDEHIAALVAAIDARRRAFDSLREVCQMDIFCGVFTTADTTGHGFTLDPSLVCRLCELRLDLVFDIY